MEETAALAVVVVVVVTILYCHGCKRKKEGLDGGVESQEFEWDIFLLGL